MNIDANTRAAAPEPVRKTHAGTSAPSRVSGDAAADGSAASAFLSMLQALTVDAGDAAAPATPVQRDGAAAPEDAVSDAGLHVPPQAVVAAPVAATAAAPDVAAGARPARALGASNQAAADGLGGASSKPEPAQQQALRMASDLAAAQAEARHADAAAPDGGALARQRMADAAEAVASARAGSQARTDGIVQARDGAQAAAVQTLAAAPGGAGATAVVSMFEAGLAGLRAGPLGRTHERGAARVPLALDTAPAGFVAWSDASPLNQGAQPANPVYAPTAATPAPSTAMAQKLHYWVAGGVQSAELQLDAFGGGAVDVHIAVKGEQAFVEFRSDQPQARKLLLDTMPQLEQLLAGEGLLLSGGFVGGSGQQPSDGAGARPDRLAAARGGAMVRAAAVVIEAPASASARGAAGSAVDLFV